MAEPSGLTGQALADAFAKMTPAEQKEIAQIVQHESQKSQNQTVVHDLTDVCWKKCVANSRISSNKLASGEETCMRNCVGRFMDTSYTVLAHLNKLRAGQ